MAETTFDETDRRMLAAFLHPDYGWLAAIEHGAGDPILGSKAAWREVRKAVLRVTNAAFAREPRKPARVLARDRAFVSGLLGLAHRMEDLQPVDPPWPAASFRKLMAQGGRSDAPWPIYGSVDLPWPDRPAGDDLARLAVCRAVGELLVGEPGLNRAVLPPYPPGVRVWIRRGGQVLVPVELRPDWLWVLRIDPLQPTLEALRSTWKETLRRTLLARKHPLAGLMDRLAEAWMQRGFLASFAGAMISDASGLTIGQAQPVFIPGNGVPLSISINPPRGGLMRLGIAVDHRAFDASHGARIHECLSRRVAEIGREGGW